MRARSVAIGGFMATGKSTVGPLLADRLGCGFLDLDREIESHVGKSISTIFHEDGEREFRRWETLVLERIRVSPRHVVALGGGTLHQQVNHSLLSRYRVLVLHTSWRELRARLRNESTERPLSADAETLYQRRLDGYSEIGIGLNIEGKNPRQVVEMMLLALGDETK